MARARMMSADDEQVGAGSGDFFKVESGRKYRVALVPLFIPKASLEISEDLKKRGEAGEKAAQEEIEDKIRLEENLKAGLVQRPDAPARVQFLEKFDWMGKPQDGYLFGPTFSHMVHYDEKEKQTFLCKADEFIEKGYPPICCDKMKELYQAKGSANPSYCVVMVVYKTDADGNIIVVPPERQKVLDDKNRLDFDYELKFCNMHDSRFRAWKEHTSQFPFIRHDFKVFLEKKGKFEVQKFGACADLALWQKKGPVLMKKVLTEGAGMWEQAGSRIAKDFSLEDIATMFGVKLAATSSAANEVSFSSLLNQ